jgi:ABC-type branched-subunit amino acid transport system ATPase component/branched-subunit amino acid ABC-type transport system permease component
MHEFLPFIVIGIATGAVYGLAGMGLVLTYKTSGILNFGYGAVAALNVFCFYFLHVSHKLPWPYATAICLFVIAPLLGLALEVLARSLEGSTDTVKVVATVGLILIVESIGLLWHPLDQPTFPHFLSQSTIRILGVNITWEQIILFLFSCVAAAGLYWFFQSVRFGIVMRGVVDNHELVSMSGDDPVAVRRWAWIIGTVFASIAGLLLAPDLTLEGVTLTTAVFAAFGAAAIGFFSNLPLTFIGGLVIGVAGALVDKYAATISWIGGLSPALPFVVLFVVLIVTPRARLVQRRLAPTNPVRQPYQAPVPIRLSAGAIAIGLLAIIPIIQSGHIAVWSEAVIDIILFLSLGLLVRRSGQISLCHLAFAAVGCAAFGHFAGLDGLPWLLALVLATIVAIPVGAIIAIPAVRVSGVFLALATLGFGILAEQVFYTRSFMFGDSTLGIPCPRPHVSIGGWNLSSDKGFYYLLLLIMVLIVVTISTIGRGRLGRLLEAMADSPLALETQGATTSVLKVIVFCIAAAMASLAGALTGMLFHFGIGTYFPSFNSLTLVVLVVIITIGDPWYAVLAAVGYTVIPSYVTGETTNNVLTLLFGLGAATAAYGTRFGGAPTAVRDFVDRVGGRRAVSKAPSMPPLLAKVPLGDSGSRRPPGRDEGLVVRDLTVRFGGVTAVDGVTLQAKDGVITGLIGPNGAGKTTIFNACSGLNRPSKGTISLAAKDLSGSKPSRRAREGLGRTFQRPELFNSLTVYQNVAIGREAAMAGRNPLLQIFGSRRASEQVSKSAEEALDITGTSRLADEQVGLLPIGQRRLVELARALAGPFDFLLLDEPSSGLDVHETEEFGRVLKTIVRERGYGVLLVEHDMTLVREVCDYVYVLEFGSLIFQGTSFEMHESDVVRAAYLGDVAAESRAAE